MTAYAAVRASEQSNTSRSASRNFPLKLEMSI